MARARASDAQAVMAKQRAMRAAENHIARGRQIPIGREGQGQARVRALVDPAAHLIIRANDEAVEKRVARAKLEALRAGVG